MNTSKLDAIRLLLKTHSEKHVIQAVWAAYQLTEEEAVRMVNKAQFKHVEVKGYVDPFLEATEWLTVEQGKPEGIAITCAPELTVNSTYKHADKSDWFIRKSDTSSVWGDACQNELHYNGRTILKHNIWPSEVMFFHGLSWSDKTEKLEPTWVVVPESFMYQPFKKGDYTNENTNRAC